MNAHNENRIEELLRQALPPADPAAAPSRDLWPAVLRRLDAEPSTQIRAQPLPWFDCALLAGLILFAVSFPATIPVFLYYL